MGMKYEVSSVFVEFKLNSLEKIKTYLSRGGYSPVQLKQNSAIEKCIWMKLGD